jgi:hypothetical protein
VGDSEELPSARELVARKFANARARADVYPCEAKAVRAFETVHGGLAVMKLFKVVLVLIALFLMVLGGLALYGLFFVLLKWAVILGVLALAGVGAYKMLSKSDKPQLGELSSAELEMMKAERMLADLKRNQLTK